MADKARDVKAKLLDNMTAKVDAHEDAERFVSLKRAKGDRKATPVAPGGDDYPWGLRLSLDAGTLDKLGLTKLPKVGATLRLECKAKVVAVSQNASEAQTQKSVELQITDACLD